MDRRFILREPKTPSTERYPENCVIRGDDLPPSEPPLQQLDHLEAGEHKLTAEALKLRTVSGTIFNANEIELATIRGTINLKFGDIIALAGDFFTNREPGHGYYPICGAPGFGESGVKDETQRFRNAVTSLTGDADGFLTGLMGLLKREHKAVVDTRSSGESVALAYHTHDTHDACGIPTDEEWAKKTGGILFGWTTEMHYLYAYIAFTNVDHFGNDAITAYSVGHNIALQLAFDASQEGTSDAKSQKLKEAYIYEAFASHYLTDLFSSGHIRAPRRQLHSPSVKMMTALKVTDYVLNRETPIWDYQQRYMHDDDCATGILVQNRHGHKWIMYGDKQFFAPKNVINRARATHALQLSVDELYLAGVRAQYRPSDDWRQNKAHFRVLDWIAQPMTSIAGDAWVESWGGHDIHNPAPLWQANNDAPDPERDWTIRCEINDHSDFGRRKSASPAPLLSLSATQECIDIRDADFRGDNQFPYEKMMSGLVTGGFIQVQHLRTADGPETLAVNWWRPIGITIAGQSNESFTLYSRNLGHEFGPFSFSVTETKSLHWLSHITQENPLVLTQLVWAKSQISLEGFICLKQYVFVSTHPGHSRDGTRAGIDIGNPGKINLAFTGSTLLMCNVKGTKETSLARFFSGNYLSNPNGLDTVCVLIDPSRIRVATHNFANKHPQESSVSGMAMTDHDVVFIRPFKVSKNKDASCAILLAKASSGNSIIRCEFSRISFNENAQAERSALSMSEFPSFDSKQGPCILVGDVFGSGVDQALCMSEGVTSNTSSVNIVAYGLADSGEGMIQCGKHQCDLNEVMPLVQSYLTALTPSLSGEGLDVLQISLHQGADGRKKLLFRTHTRNDQGPGHHGDPWSGCRQSEWLDDPLASDPNGRYFNMKWIRCRSLSPEGGYFCGVLEVFSWYGIIGTRLFCPGSSHYRYELIGQQPYLGQTSIAAGTGCTGDWSHGIIPWSSKEDWVDSATFQPWNKNDLQAGSWGMMKRDLDRPRVEGWDVGNRPMK